MWCVQFKSAEVNRFPKRKKKKNTFNLYISIGQGPSQSTSMPSSLFQSFSLTSWRRHLCIFTMCSRTQGSLRESVKWFNIWTNVNPYNSMRHRSSLYVDTHSACLHLANGETDGKAHGCDVWLRSQTGEHLPPFRWQSWDPVTALGIHLPACHRRPYLCRCLLLSVWLQIWLRNQRRL